MDLETLGFCSSFLLHCQILENIQAQMYSPIAQCQTKFLISMSIFFRRFSDSELHFMVVILI